MTDSDHDRDRRKKVIDEVLAAMADMHWLPFYLAHPDAERLGADIQALRKEMETFRVDMFEGRLHDLGRVGVISCPMVAGAAPEGGAAVTELVRFPGSRTQALRDLRRMCKEVERLTIVDPYIFHGDKRWRSLPETARAAKYEDYVDELNEIIGAARDVDFFHLPSAPKELLSIARKQLGQGRKLRRWETNEIHDRVWILDRNTARVIGTSFSGLGDKKFAFELELPRGDLAVFNAELDKIRDANASLWT